MKKNKRIVLVVGVSLAVVLLAAAAYFTVKHFTNTSNTTNDTSKDADSSIKKVDLSTTNFKELTTEVAAEKIDNNDDYLAILDKYAERALVTINEIRMSDPTKWDTAMVEKAYFVIAYARKTSDYPIIDRTLVQLKAAQDAGVSIDNAPAGINQAYRDTLRAETDDALSNPDYLPTDTKREL